MRSFLAVSPASSLRNEIAHVQQSLRTALEPQSSRSVRVTWTKSDSIHLTFRFFAELDEDLTEPLREATSAVAGSIRAFEIPLTRIGAFPRTQAPRVLWLGPSREWEQSGDGQRLVALARTIDDACAGLRLGREDKPWHPHVTLGRVKEGERMVGSALSSSRIFEDAVDAGALRVHEIDLIRSDAGRGGHTYTTLWRALLSD